jgi:hypothetical protein
MAQEDLMNQLPKGYERVSKSGIFFIRDNGNGGPWSVMAQTVANLGTFGGPEGKYWATRLARALNNTNNRVSREHTKFIHTLK